MSIDQNNLNDVLGKDVLGSDGNKIGEVGQVYLDDVTGKPEWVTVKTGMFGNKESFVPVAQSQFADDGLRVPYGKDTVKDAPRVDADQGHLSQDEEAELYRHYGLDYSGDESDSGLPDTDGNDQRGLGQVDTSGRTDADRYGDSRDLDADGTVGHDTSGPTTDDAMTRSEEQLKVGTQTREAGRARLRKHVVTEEQTVTVPVSREEVIIEREPITDANRDEALAGPEISEEEHEVVLTEERPVVAKETVAVERVKLGKETVTDTEQVTESVRKEQIDTDGVDLPDTSADDTNRR
ncbi:PRC and DUF2382 domain-containing protein [Phycicoccus jejuensis]|uniref:DUF2382 domain-containing protein n=1 Tax=Phycicoccus TaxID=367298 RepID=UPI001C00623A|nr:PRC and DUF2382 domain-containing protein [Phycicoccus mangrovi]MBT9257752.1 PRC and DUF2382 domain-containing protein [Phycicoccus mangrovi]